MDSNAAGAPTELVADGAIASDLATYTAARTAVTEFRVPAAPELVVGQGPRPTVSVGELVAAGALTVLESPPTLVTVAAGDAMFSAKDVRLDRGPSVHGDGTLPGAVTARPGDVVLVTGGGPSVVSVWQETALMGPGIAVLRVNPKVIDAGFLAGVVRAWCDAAGGRPIDLFAVAFPRMPIGEQRVAGAAVVRLLRIETQWRRTRSVVEQLVERGLAGISSGTWSAVPETDGPHG
ncbi:hypothetical protein [Nocardia lasii]|uniref:Uncharacterized protein n=1 Tax=Nocardia lasii TaxID=1616107 RepID=A0ABW1JUX7_9NOCA